MRNAIEKLIRRLYIPPFNKIIPYQTFQYVFCGGSNTVFDLSLYAFLYNFVFDKKNVDLGFIVITPYIAAFLIVFPITFLTGFWLMNCVVFKGSTLRNRTKLGRYLLTVCLSILINYVGLKVCVEYLHFYPTPSKTLITILCALVSYLSQRYFTFRNYERVA